MDGNRNDLKEKGQAVENMDGSGKNRCEKVQHIEAKHNSRSLTLTQLEQGFDFGFGLGLSTIGEWIRLPEVDTWDYSVIGFGVNGRGFRGIQVMTLQDRDRASVGYRSRNSRNRLLTILDLILGRNHRFQFKKLGFQTAELGLDMGLTQSSIRRIINSQGLDWTQFKTEN